MLAETHTAHTDQFQGCLCKQVLNDKMKSTFPKMKYTNSSVQWLGNKQITTSYLAYIQVIKNNKDLPKDQEN